MIKLKRAYEAASKDDGLRILVERLWPRGVSVTERPNLLTPAEKKTSRFLDMRIIKHETQRNIC
jgi:uncharacterized protein YeaO (DUF488 family)